jgi:hypothetical protein
MKKNRRNIILALVVSLLLILATNVVFAGNNGGNNLSFDGTNDSATISDHDGLDIQDELTIEFWFYLAGNSADTKYPRAVSKGQSTSDNGAYGVFIGDLRMSNHIGLRFIDTSNTTHDIDSTTLDNYANQWHHVAAVYSNSADRGYLYVDGVLESSPVIVGDVRIRATTDNLQIGAANNQRFFNGYIDEVRIWNVARSSDEINDAMFAVLNTGDYSDLEAYYKFDALGGAWDETNNHNGTISGATPSLSTAPIWDKVAGSHTDMAGIWAPQTTDVSFGMTITDNSFLGELSDDLIFGVSADDPSNPNVNTDLPTTGDWITAPDPARWSTVWYCDLNDPTGDGGTVDITFDYDVIKSLFMPDDTTVANYRLLERPGTTGNFSDIGTATSVNETERTVTFAGVDISGMCSYLTLGTLDNTNSPTAISLTSLTATAARNTWIPMALISVSLVGVGTLTWLRRKRQE